MAHSGNAICVFCFQCLSQAVNIQACFCDETFQYGFCRIRIITGKSGKGGKIQGRRRGGINSSNIRLQHTNLCKQFIHRKRLMQTSGKTMLQKLLTLHITTGSNGNHRNCLGLRDIRSTQQPQQIETIHGRHLHIGQQHIKSISTEGFQKFIQLQAGHGSNTTLCKHGSSESKLNAVIINQENM